MLSRTCLASSETAMAREGALSAGRFGVCPAMGGKVPAASGETFLDICSGWLRF
jgi:hypothetical protein